MFPLSEGQDPTATLRDGGYIQRCYQLAENAIAVGDHPFGAVLVHADVVIAEAANQVGTLADVTRHAELVLVGAVSRSIASEVLAESTLYSSTEPCPMCVGAIHWAGIARVVYGVAAVDLAEVVGRPYQGVPIRELVRRAGYRIAVKGPVMEDDGLRIHKEFWPKRR